MQSNIEQYLKLYFDAQHEDLSIVSELFKKQEIKKGDYLLKIGKYNANLSFIKKGYLRLFAFNTDSTKEITQWIASPDTFVTDLSSLIFASPARWNIQALEDCELYTISHDDYHRIGEQIPSWDKIEKRFIIKCFHHLENRVFSQLSMSSEERYDLLFQQDSNLFNQVPLQYLASMLGMTPETFSRIRKKRSS